MPLKNLHKVLYLLACGLLMSSPPKVVPRHFFKVVVWAKTSFVLMPLAFASLLGGCGGGSREISGDANDAADGAGNSTNETTHEFDPVELAELAETVLANVLSDIGGQGIVVNHYLPYRAGYGFGVTQTQTCGGHKGTPFAIDFNIIGPVEQQLGLEAHASAGGVVIRAVKHHTGFKAGSYGNYILLQHDDGTFSLYAHLAYASVTLSVGDRVCQGAVLGVIANTGNSFGDHEHYERWDQNGNRVNPTFVEVGTIPDVCSHCTTSSPYAGECYVSQNVGVCHDVPPRCPNGSGYYCGDLALNQDPNNRYYCENGQYVEEQCDNGCQRQPPLTDDTCMPNPCGDGSCNGTETAASCPQDCPSTPTCGDGSCNGTETTASCGQDCPSTPTCGDGACAEVENYVTCPADCSLPPDPVCSANIAYPTPAYTCEGGSAAMVMRILSISYDLNTYEETVVVDKEGETFGPGNYRIVVFDPNDEISDQCRSFNTKKAEQTVGNNAPSQLVFRFPSSMSCQNPGAKRYCAQKEAGGNPAHFCSTPADVTLSLVP